MSLSTTTVFTGPYIPSSLPAVLATGFQFNLGADLVVTDLGPIGAPFASPAILTLGSDYTITGGGYDSHNNLQTGSITVVSSGVHSVAAFDQITIQRVTSETQTVSFENTGMLTVPMIEKALDKAMSIDQEQSYALQGYPTDLSTKTVKATGTTTARTLADRFARGPFNVRDFGAIGDGSVDDSAAVQAALNAAIGCELYVPKGIYAVRNLIIKSGTKLIGEGEGSAFLFNATTFNDSMFKNFAFGLTTDSEIEFHNLKFDGNGKFFGSVYGGGTPLINIDGTTNPKISNCRVTNYNYIGIAMSSCIGQVIINNELDHLGYTGGPSGIPINDNYGAALWVSHVSGAVTSGALIADNYIHDCGWHGMQFNGQTSVIRGNRIFNVHEVGIFYPCDSYSLTKPQYKNIISNNVIKGVRFKSLSAHGIEGLSSLTVVSGNHFSDIDGVGIACIFGVDNVTITGNVFDSCGQILSASSACIALGNTTTNPFKYIIINNNIFSNQGSVSCGYGVTITIYSGTTNAFGCTVANNIFDPTFSTAVYVIGGTDLVSVYENNFGGDYPAPRPFANGTTTTKAAAVSSNSDIISNGGTNAQLTIETDSPASIDHGPSFAAFLRTGNGVNRYFAGGFQWKKFTAAADGDYRSYIDMVCTSQGGSVLSAFKLYNIYGTGKTGAIFTQQLTNAVNDAAAAAASVAVNGLYRNGSVVMIRVA